MICFHQKSLIQILHFETENFGNVLRESCAEFVEFWPRFLKTWRRLGQNRSLLKQHVIKQSRDTRPTAVIQQCLVSFRVKNARTTAIRLQKYMHFWFADYLYNFADLWFADWHTWEICRFAIAEHPQVFADLQLADFKKKVFAYFLFFYSAAEYARTFNSTLTPKSLKVIKIQENKQAPKK